MDIVFLNYIQYIKSEEKYLIFIYCKMVDNPSVVFFFFQVPEKDGAAHLLQLADQQSQHGQQAPPSWSRPCCCPLPPTQPLPSLLLRSPFLS